MKKRPLNFLHFTTFYPPYSFGGDAMYIYRLAHALGDEGHQISIVHNIDAYHMQHPGEPEIAFDEHPRVKRYGLKSKVTWLAPLIAHQTGRPYLYQDQIDEVIKSKPFDVIQYHNISLLGPEIMQAKPVNEQVVKIYMTHEHWLICPTHVLWKFNRRACEKPDCLTCTLMARRPPQLWRYTGKLIKDSQQVDQFYSPSRFTAKMHANRGFPQRVVHLPYFIDRSDNDWKNPRPRPQEKPYFLFVGRLEKIKGLEGLIDIWGQAPDVDLLIVGTGTQADELHARSHDNPRIKFLGAMSQKELGNLYYHALATIVTSITYETFGIIIVESFARKTPVIVRNLGALPEVVQESGGGYIFNSDEELLSAVSKFVGQPELRSELGELGYRAFLDKWCRDAHMKMYFDNIDQLAIKKFGRLPWGE